MFFLETFMVSYYGVFGGPLDSPYDSHPELLWRLKFAFVENPYVYDTYSRTHE